MNYSVRADAGTRTPDPFITRVGPEGREARRHAGSWRSPPSRTSSRTAAQMLGVRARELRTYVSKSKRSLLPEGRRQLDVRVHGRVLNDSLDLGDRRACSRGEAIIRLSWHDRRRSHVNTCSCGRVSVICPQVRWM